MSDYRYPKKLHYAYNKLIIDGHHTADEIWDYLLSLGVYPDKDVKEIEIMEIRRGLGHIELESFTNLEKVVFGEGITRIPFELFQAEFVKYENETSKTKLGFTKLKEVVCEDVEVVEPYAFWKCGLRSVTFKKPCAIMPNAFRDCANLKEVNLSSGSVLSRYIFANCPLSKVIVPAKCVVNLLAFGGAKSLKSVYIDSSCSVREPLFDNKRNKVDVIKIGPSQQKDG